MMNVDLTTMERDALADALESAYYNQSVLEQFIFFGLGENPDSVAAPGTLPARVMEVIRWAEGRGRTDELVRAAHEGNPGNPRLQQFWHGYLGSTQRQVTRDALERLTSSAIDLKNPVKWRDQMARAESCVCRILVDDTPAGTGFLAGPGLVITNHHVIERCDEAQIQAEFGYRIAADGKLEDGERHAVTGPALARQPYSSVDGQYPRTALPGPDELDYAVLPVGGQPELAMVDGRARGTLAPSAAPRLSPGALITIIQHPLGERLQFAYDQVIEINGNQTRVTYKVQTRKGSSGSPCFDADWNLVALHHGGDPRTGVQIGEYNEGIPITAIRASLPADVASRLGWARPGR